VQPLVGNARRLRSSRGSGSRYLALLYWMLLCCAQGGCSGQKAEPSANISPSSHARSDRAPAMSPARLTVKVDPGSDGTAVETVRFHDIARSAGVDFVYLNGADGRELMVESLGGGAAWLDYDADGNPDVYFTQGGKPDSSDRASEPHDVLFRQRSSGQFRAVTDAACIDSREYGMGIAAADYDQDGFDDLYVTAVGPNRLFRNCGDGTFTEVTVDAGVNDDRWSTSTAWGDLDLDGDLDLYCCNYLQYDPLNPLECLQGGRPALCHPRQLEAWPDECFENLGDGTFARSSSQWKLQGDEGKGLGVVIADLNNDGRPDVFVANDTTANFLFLGTETGQFEESALRVGGALSAEGAMQASMGIAAGDYDGNGYLDLLLTHFTGESNTLYQNLGDSGLHDVSGLAGIRRISNDFLGFGAVMHDFDQSGSPELLIANGHIDSQNADGAGYEQPACLMTFDGAAWIDISSRAGDYFSQPKVGRGTTAADFDQDGDLDVLIVNQNSQAALLENVSQRGHWLKLRLIGGLGNRSAIGTRVVVRQGNKVRMQELAGGTSYCASQQKVLVFGLGDANEPCSLEVHWPGGGVQNLSAVSCDQELVVIELDSSDV